jgi:hypothetical protein
MGNELKERNYNYAEHPKKKHGNQSGIAILAPPHHDDKIG